MFLTLLLSNQRGWFFSSMKAGNNVTGTIPTELGLLSNLEAIDVGKRLIHFFVDARFFVTVVRENNSTASRDVSPHRRLEQVDRTCSH